MEIYLVDFKSGTEFKIYADYNLPNFKVIAIESEQEFGLSVLRNIKKEGHRYSIHVQKVILHHIIIAQM